MTPTNPPPKTPALDHHHHDDHLYGADALHNEDVAHEHTDVNVRQLLMYTFGLVAVCVFSAVLMVGLFKVLSAQAAKNDPQLSPHARAEGQEPPEPRLLRNEPKILQGYLKEQSVSLNEYAWIDQAAGVARLPISQAKKLLLERGLPARQGAPGDAWIGTRAASRGESSSGRAIPLKPGSQPADAQAAPAKPADPHKGHQ